MNIRGIGLSKTIQQFSILESISLEIQSGEFLAITGKSGSGKSSLLYLLSGIDFPTKGKLLINNTNYYELSDDRQAEFRFNNIGFMFQFHYLISELTALENALLPCRNEKNNSPCKKRAKELFERLEIGHCQNKYPEQMSGGENQRVALVHATIKNPPIVFADEPTGSLDSKNSNVVMEHLKEVNNKNRTTIVLVTHDKDIAQTSKRMVTLHDGKIVYDSQNP